MLSRSRTSLIGVGILLLSFAPAFLRRPVTRPRPAISLIWPPPRCPIATRHYLSISALPTCSVE